MGLRTAKKGGLGEGGNGRERREEEQEEGEKCGQLAFSSRVAAGTRATSEALPGTQAIAPPRSRPHPFRLTPPPTLLSGAVQRRPRQQSRGEQASIHPRMHSFPSANGLREFTLLHTRDVARTQS
ncbi:CHAT isoform 8 [Pongo abelii]|uniref:CHAT isoform 8 n=1 Tax=Pongo abelii TaxID=9601 RepID=A0A2J8RT19_PONAB|nr:CHAT isoform 8 [Pongo abelii]